MATIHWQISFILFEPVNGLCAAQSWLFLLDSFCAKVVFQVKNPPTACPLVPAHLKSYAATPTSVGCPLTPLRPLLVALCNTLASLSAILSRVTLGHCSWRYASNARLKDVESTSTATARVMCPDVYTFVCSCHSIARLKKKIQATFKRSSTFCLLQQKVVSLV